MDDVSAAADSDVSATQESHHASHDDDGYYYYHGLVDETSAGPSCATAAPDAIKGAIDKRDSAERARIEDGTLADVCKIAGVML